MRQASSACNHSIKHERNLARPILSQEDIKLEFNVLGALLALLS